LYIRREEPQRKRAYRRPARLRHTYVWLMFSYHFSQMPARLWSDVMVNIAELSAMAPNHVHSDDAGGPPRCIWPGHDPLYVDHHDREWGVPVHDGRALWEHLVLDGFQAGLSWLTVLRKRENFRKAFAGFNPERVAVFNDSDVARLLRDPGIIRSKVKINAAISNARAYCAMLDVGYDFSSWVWHFTEGASVQNAWKTQSDVPVVTSLATEISKALKDRGFKFVGPTMVYAWMQAVGLVNDHVVACFRHSEISRLAARRRPHP
jgi:DNA-3-methyladenine glycosylase I